MNNLTRILTVFAICIFGAIIVFHFGCGSGDPLTNTSTNTNSSSGTGGQDPSGGSGGPAGTTTNVTVGGVAGCITVVPSGYSDSNCVPLLLTWCGNPGTSPSQMTTFWTSTANSKVFIVCSIPHAVIDGEAITRSEGLKAAGIRDELFTLYNIDKNSVFVNGFSGGGQIAFYAAINVSGFHGNMCMSSCKGTNDWGDVNGAIPIWWRTATNDPYFPDSTCSGWASQCTSHGYNVNYQAISGSSHSLSIHNAGEAWDWTFGNKP